MGNGGGGGNSFSEFDRSISDDGRYVVFRFGPPTWYPGTQTASDDIFVHDRQTRIDRAGERSLRRLPGKRRQFTFSSISADGRYVAFQSDAPNLVPGDTNGTDDIFVHDRQTRNDRAVSVASDGSQANAGVAIPRSARDGRYVAFTSDAGNLVPGDRTGRTDIFVHDRQTEHDRAGECGLRWFPGKRSDIETPSISADGLLRGFRLGGV